MIDTMGLSNYCKFDILYAPRLIGPWGGGGHSIVRHTAGDWLEGLSQNTKISIKNNNIIKRQNHNPRNIYLNE